MTKKLSTHVLYGLLLSIILLMTGFLALGVRAFASAVVSDFIYLVTFGILLTVIPMYFVLRRPLVGAAITRKIGQLPSAWPSLVRRQRAPMRKDRRRPLLLGQERTVIAHERRRKQSAGFRGTGPETVASEI